MLRDAISETSRSAMAEDSTQGPLQAGTRATRVPLNLCKNTPNWLCRIKSRGFSIISLHPVHTDDPAAVELGSTILQDIRAEEISQEMKGIYDMRSGLAVEHKLRLSAQRTTLQRCDKR